ncbi:glycoside hydrolase family 2 protein [Edaphobacter sp.]|uniref:glycoside hydrolase family 2 protein n=1 Tax=Edaphobacter sp. TaxID=1934404 RepID=UPI002DB7EE64|nr:glycoside hydrolase family 2 TIM barrel-domain containing protein [Edaphobacter sp.]HEU5340015.1 glycoside hydrolase family 2 TIM barrel-domain containing protein [Edaphobacter sp.]
MNQAVRLLLAASLALPATLLAQTNAYPPSEVTTQNTTLLVDIDHRPATSLDGEWHTLVDPYGNGIYDFHHHVKARGYFMDAKPQPGDEYDFSTSPTLKVPGDWNTQRPNLFYYEGPIWYEKDFEHTSKPNTRTFIHFGAANYRSYVWVNTNKVCEHEGGFTPFDCDITGVVRDGHNFVVVVVDNSRIPDGVPTLQTDWWNYGGLHRDVSVVDVPEQFIDDYDLHLVRTADEASTNRTVEGYVHVEGAAAGTAVTVSIPELHASVQATTDANARAAITLPIKSLTLWSPDAPKLYKVELTAGSGATEDKLEDDMGFRTVEARGTEILLNGKPIFLRGVSIHAEAPYRTGRAYSEKDVDTLLGWCKELGCNFARLAHYPHDQRMTRAADRLGILIWSEIPDYWALQFDNPVVLQKSKQQMREMIRRDRDKASVILWSVANETPNTEARTKYLTAMANYARELDPTRLVTAALLVRTVKSPSGPVKVVDDPLGAALDVIGTNEYIGWYDGPIDSIDKTTWDIHYQKPLIMSEWGGGARFGNHAKPGEKPTPWTEEYQAEIYRHQIPMLNKIPQLRGTTPWVLMDFRSPMRTLPGKEDNFNRKGLISDQGQKKEAFYILQKAYKDKTLGKAE